MVEAWRLGTHGIARSGPGRVIGSAAAGTQPTWRGIFRVLCLRPRSRKAVALSFFSSGRIGRPKKRAGWARLLDARGIPNGPINTLDQVVADAQTQALGMVQTKPGSDLGLVGLPLSFDGIRPAFVKAGPGWRPREPPLANPDRSAMGPSA